MIHVRPKHLLVLAAGALALAGPACTSKTPEKLGEDISVETTHMLTPEEKGLISRAAAKTLRHVAAARGDLHDHHIDKARQELDDARMMIQVIRDESPSVTVKDRIWVARKHLEYEDSGKVLPDLVPIYSELEQIKDFLPTDAAREHLDKAKEHMKNGNSELASSELESASNAIVYGEIDLPVNTTLEHIQDAQSALAQKDTKKADEDLRQIEDVISVVLIQPEGSAATQPAANQGAAS